MSKQVLIMPLPPGALGSYSVGAVTGALTFTLATNDIIFAFRWGNSVNCAVVDYVAVSVSVAGAITTGVVTGLELVPVKDFWNAYTGGTNLLGASPDNDKKLKTSFPTSLVSDLQIATTIPLELPHVPGTPDTIPIAQVIFGTGTTASSTLLDKTALFHRDTNSYPLILTQDEGFVIRMALNGPASGSLRVSVNAHWIEMSKQVF